MPTSFIRVAFYSVACNVSPSSASVSLVGGMVSIAEFVLVWVGGKRKNALCHYIHVLAFYSASGRSHEAFRCQNPVFECSKSIVALFVL